MSPNRSWEIAGRADPVVRIGARRLRLAEVTSFGLSAHEERDFLPSLFNYSVYLIVAAIFLILVVHAGWRERFLLATVFFAIVGFTSLVDVWKANPIRLYRLRLAAAGGAVDFTSADPAEVDRLASALRQAGIPQA